MENIPIDAAGAAPASQTEAISTSASAPASTPEATAPNLYGFTEAQLEEMSKFYSANGGYEKGFARIKSAISNPQQFEQSQAPASQPQAQPTQPQTPQQPVYKAPEGSITAQEFLAQQYFQALSSDPKYSSISTGIANGDYLKEMAAFGISALNQDGSINDQKVRMYLDLKAQTVPAKPTGAEPGMSSAPTVEYYQVAGDKVTNMDDAYKILAQDMQLKASGQAGHPLIQSAEEFIRTGGKPAEKK